MSLSKRRADLAKLRGEKPACSACKATLHRTPKILRFVACAWLVLMALTGRIHAYTFLTPIMVWPDGTIPMDLQFYIQHHHAD